MLRNEQEEKKKKKIHSQLNNFSFFNYLIILYFFKEIKIINL